MYDMIFCLLAVIHLFLIAGIVKRTFKNIVLRIISILLMYFSVNTLSGLLGFYMHRESIDRWYLLAGQVVFVVLEYVLYKLCWMQQSCVQETFDKMQLQIWSVCFLGLMVLLLFSTGGVFMPAWGNADEAVHFEMSVQFRNILDGGNQPLYQNLSDIMLAINRYSYLWAYHYNCAVISKVLHCDVLYINHIMKCLSLSAFVTIPMMWIQTRKKNTKWIMACYMGCMVLFAGNWYVFLRLGYSAQLFSLAVCHAVILLVICQRDEHRIFHDVMLPVYLLFCLLSYMLTGAMLLLLLFLYAVVRHRFKTAGILLATCLYMVPIPPILNQIKIFIYHNGTSDEALTAGSSLKSAPSVVWIVIVVFFGLSVIWMWKHTIRKNLIWISFGALELLAFTGLYLFYDNDGYIIYKIMISIFPVLILSVCCFTAGVIPEIFEKNILRYSLCIVSLLAAGAVLVHEDIAKISLESIKRIYCTEPQITVDEYQCLQKIVRMNTGYDGVEYIGMNGPSAMTGYVFTGKWPFSAYGSSSKWRFKGNFYIKDIFKSMIERSLNGDSSVREIYVLINEEKTEDLENLDRYQAFLKENKEIYRMGHCAVRKLVFYDMDFERMMYGEFINKSEYIEKDVPSYGTVALVKELQKNIKYRYKLSDRKEIFSILVTGRSIHESYFTLRLYNGTSLVFEKDLSGFEKDFLIDLKNPVSCDACEIETVGKNFSDSIIIKSVDIGTKNETYEMER